MRYLIVATVAIVAALLLDGCRDATLTDYAELRVAQLEVADTLNHDGFALLPPCDCWRGEILASSSEPLTLSEALALWYDSPPHRAILEHRWTHFGFATSDSVSLAARFYAVMLVEERE